jgi:hypothetical protein
MAVEGSLSVAFPSGRNASIRRPLFLATRYSRPYSSSSFTSPRAAFAFSIIFSCSAPGTVS